MGDDCAFQSQNRKNEKSTSSHLPPSTPTTTPISGSDADRFNIANKLAQVTEAWEYPADISRLAALATSPGGLVTDELRRLICTHTLRQSSKSMQLSRLIPWFRAHSVGKQYRITRSRATFDGLETSSKP